MSTVRRLAEQPGSACVGSSEINANPKDTADYARRRLDPAADRCRLKDKDRAKYVAIGESDRMTLKFVKPR